MIYDCFMFYDEIDLLNIRLHTLYPVVDKFVLVESTETFPGAKKPLYYAESKNLFKKFSDKIIHLVYDKLPTEKGEYADLNWAREGAQRNFITTALSSCAPDDVIMISDADEIPEPGMVLKAANSKMINNFRIVFAQSLHVGHLNRRVIDKAWTGTGAVKFKNFTEPNKIRRYYETTFFLVTAGWHFSWIGSSEQQLRKLMATAHQEINTEENRALVLKEEVIFENQYVVDSCFDAYPDYVKENVDALRKNGLIL